MRRLGHFSAIRARRSVATGLLRCRSSPGPDLTMCDTVPLMANGRLRSIGSTTPRAVAPLSEEEELLRKLVEGEITREEYNDAVVDRGIAHLHGRVPPEQLQIVRECLREEVESSPVLAKILADAITELPKSATR